MTLTPQQIADGWKPHDGGPRPIPEGARPTYMCRNGWIGRPSDGQCAGDFVWRWESEPADWNIIAYREAGNGR